MTGVIIGSVMLRNFCQPPAPSIVGGLVELDRDAAQAGQEDERELPGAELGDQHERELRVGRVAEPVGRRQSDGGQHAS